MVTFSQKMMVHNVLMTQHSFDLPSRISLKHYLDVPPCLQDRKVQTLPYVTGQKWTHSARTPAEAGTHQAKQNLKPRALQGTAG